MKKMVTSFFVLLFSLTLVGCSQSVQEELQTNNWHVVFANGETYTADFGESTVIFDSNLFQRGFSYTIDDEEENITLNEPDTEDEPIIFSTTENDNSFTFEALTEEVRAQYGNLTLSPKTATD